jgi:excisionase family DNA binding protein
MEVCYMSHVTATPEVLTLEEVATYLRLPQDTIVRHAVRGNIPGRQIEDTWRFLKAAIDEWLRSHDSRTLLLQQAGVLAKDESLTALRESIYAERQRPEVEAHSDS